MNASNSIMDINIKSLKQQIHDDEILFNLIREEILNKIAKEELSNSIKIALYSILTLINEYYELSKRILQEISYFENQRVLDPMVISSLLKNIDDLLKFRVEIKEKIAKIAMNLEKLEIERKIKLKESEIDIFEPENL